MSRRLLKRRVQYQLELADMGGHGLVKGTGLWKYRRIHGPLVWSLPRVGWRMPPRL